MRDAARQQRLSNIQSRRARIARDRGIARKKRGLVTDRRPAAAVNRLSDRLGPEIEPLGNLGSAAARKSGNQLPPTIGATQSPEFLERHSSTSYLGGSDN